MTFQELVALARSRRGLGADETLGAVLPLFRSVLALHAEGLVAPLNGTTALHVDDQYRLHVAPAVDADLDADVDVDVDVGAGQPRDAAARLATIQLDSSPAVEPASPEQTAVLQDGDPVRAPAFVTGWTRWEHLVGHHDALTDIASLGEVTASLLCGLDLSDRDDVQTLARHYRNLLQLVPDLHPVIAQVISGMIQPDRRRRSQDLASIITRLETYRDQALDLDLSGVAATASSSDRRGAILEILRDRLYDLSRRNRMLYFRPTQSSLDLTRASLPSLLDDRHLTEDQLFTWRPEVSRQLLSGRPIALGAVLRWDETQTPAGRSLDRLIAGARRDRAEYGQAQLRLVVAFLRWHDLKADQNERIDTPLLLLPVELTKRRGVRDSYVLTGESRVAEVNPMLRHLLAVRYGLDLPDLVDLAQTTPAHLHAELARQIAGTEPAVQLTLTDKPRIEVIRDQSRGYVLAGRREGQPYQWDVDLCALTLTNVNFRAMSLVRDYNDLLADDWSHEPFDRVFSPNPRPLPRHAPELTPTDRFPVIPVDASQIAAIARARTGESFVIQGPPGTGKSQTITNLIADYVAREQRVLFVCQKRAALDVVHSRLRRHGLDELTCLIHDSQSDKKAFVHGLKSTYETWLRSTETLPELEHRRGALVEGINRELDRVRGYEEAMAAEPADGGPSARVLLERLVALRPVRWPQGASAAVRQMLPSAAQWWAARALFEPLTAALARGAVPTLLAQHPARYLASAVLSSRRPDAEAALRAERAGSEVGAVLAAVEAALGGPVRVAELVHDPLVDLTLTTTEQLSGLAAVLLPLAERGRGSALSLTSSTAQNLRRDARLQGEAEQGAANASTAARGWHDPLTPADAVAALALARRHEGSMLALLRPSWRTVRRAVRERYDLTPAEGQRAPAVQPTITQRLALLVAAQQATARMLSLERAAEHEWGHADLAAVCSAFEAARRTDDPAVAAVTDLLARTENAAFVSSLAGVSPLTARARAACDAVVTDVEDLPLGDLGAVLTQIADPASAAGLRALAPLLVQLQSHAEVAGVLRRLPATFDQLEEAVAATALDDLRARVAALAGFYGADLVSAVQRVQQSLPALCAADAELIIARQSARFLDRVAHSERSVTGMTHVERVERQTWSSGRRELEHEFGKVMRYRSIRDLASGSAGVVVAALRPVWLMSPTSVSDALPLDPNLFDVVVYDEASQIPIEQAVPALHRAPQVIVVGDQMQLPPSRYFSTTDPTPERSGAPDEEFEAREFEDDLAVALDGDSFLAHSDLRLSSTMLTWHYRSRFDALIGFSNAAFYGGKLSTVPDRAVARRNLPPIVADVSGILANVSQADSAAGDADRIDHETVRASVDALLSRSISVHRLRGGSYRRRTNTGEAAYIAALVREILGRETGATIGVVAFSQAQENAIEAALDDLAEGDADFAARYERELAREVDGQFVGMFVKNLENVQGDERDIIVMSVCYAPGVSGRMTMNFGPINQRGGEKRLNVIFSRSRQRMAVVTSIDPEAITNVYNDGARAMRRFLEYAAAVSAGDDAAAGAMLSRLHSPEPAGRRGASDGSAPIGPVAEQLTTALTERGIAVEAAVGRSAFRCDLALRLQGDDEHRVAVLIDTPERAASEHLEERILSHPAVLRAAGWRVAHVLTKDWYDDPQTVLSYLVELVRQPTRVAVAPS